MYQTGKYERLFRKTRTRRRNQMWDKRIMTTIIISLGVVSTRTSKETILGSLILQTKLREVPSIAARLGTANGSTDVREPNAGSSEVKNHKSTIELLKEMSDRIQLECNTMVNKGRWRVG